MLTLTEFVLWALRLLGAINTVNTFLQSLLAALGQPAQEPTLSQVLVIERDNNGLIQQLGASDLLILTALNNIQGRLLTQIGSPQQTGKPVTLPTTPPPGYGGASGSTIAAAVWAYPDPNSGQPVVDLLSDAAFWAIFNSSAGALFPLSLHAPWWANTSVAASSPPAPNFNTFAVDFHSILPTDLTPVAWLNRVGPFGDYSDMGAGVPGRNGSDNTVYSIAWLTQVAFEALKAQLFPVAATPTAPVWPGIANVTLGASQALADGLLIPGPLDGVVIAITAVPSPISYYPFGPVKSYVHVGGIAFVDDNGQVETVQPIGLDSNVVCPKSMAQCDHAYIRLQSGVTGTVRPWLKT